MQQILELLYSFVPSGSWQRYQKPISKIIAIAAGSAWTIGTWGQRVTVPPLQTGEALLAGLVTAAMAELSNGVIKSVVYSKEARKAAAAYALSNTGSISLEVVSRK